MSAHRVRETRILDASELTTANGKLASVMTVKTRRLGGTWEYRTWIVGYRGEQAQGWTQVWDDEAAARAGHHDVCQKIFAAQGMTLQ